MLRLLTDEHISPAVATAAVRRCPGIDVVAILTWENGHFLSASDALVLEEAHKQQLTLVTFDLRTIPPLLRSWAEQGLDHSGVLFVDERTVAQNDIGGLAAAICAIWRSEANSNWTNRVVYLRRPG